MKNAKYLLTVVLVLTISILILSGCSNERHTYQSHQTLALRYTTATTTTATTTTVATPAETTVNNDIVGSCTWEYADSNGYSYSLTFSVFNPILNAVVGETSHPYDLSAKLMSSSYDPKTDLVIPATVAIKNTTSNFDIYASYNGKINGNSSVDIIIDSCYSDGNKDTFLSEEYLFGGQWTDPFSPNQTGFSRFFIIIDDYYSPNYPNGNIALLDELAFTPINYNGEYICDDMIGVFTLAGNLTEY